MPFHNFSQFVSTTLPTAAIMNQIRDNLRYFKGLDGAQAIDDAVTVQGLLSADSVRFPGMSTTQRNALTQQDGLAIYNTSVDEFQMRVDGSWENMTAAAPVNDGYTPANATNQGDLPSGVNPTAMAWDGMQLVIGDNANDRLYTLARNADGSYTPANAASQGTIYNIDGLTWDGDKLVMIYTPLGTGIERIASLVREADGSYDISNFVNYGPLAHGTWRGCTWDGQALIMPEFFNNDRLYLLTRNSDGTYTPGSVVDQGDLASHISSPSSITWDGLRLVIGDEAGDELSLLDRNSNDSYTPANAASEGNLPSVITQKAMAWDGMQLVIGDSNNDRIYTLPPDYA